ncbi:PREDICTED: uncharacterized protein LOC106116242 [Papilio xuthus]|uniref:Uncharacterized protein LOC106116242 n=1 Tax=Papilio xuthus TaxID=66420 RepID=A0AAJ6Z4X6_PAPXU|nr:PREDICTED: uncharacterized protein LOC106116242 [Papilio xuthus]
MSLINKYVFLIVVLISEVIPIQLDRHDGEIIEDQLPTSQLNKCLSVKRGAEVGVCFGEELLANLNHYDETESFSLATGVSFLRDEKTPRGLGNFLDKDPLDYRSIMEDASELISKRSLHWDMSGLCPGLAMRIGPTLSNGVLEFVLDPRIKDRGYQNHGELTTGRLLVRNLLVPFLLGLKFHIATLLPLLLGLVLLASKKAFLIAKIALAAATLFSVNGYGGQYFSGFGTTPSPTFTSQEDFGHYHSYPGGYYHRRQYKEKSAEQTTASPITPDELRDRLERLFTSKKGIDDKREETKVRNARNYAWTPINIRHN